METNPFDGAEFAPNPPRAPQESPLPPAARNDQLVDLLRQGIEAAEVVIACWSSGDLAGAVNHLEGWKNMVGEEVPELEEPDEECSDPKGHEWRHQGGTGWNDSIRCIHCGADGDA